MRKTFLLTIPIIAIVSTMPTYANSFNRVEAYSFGGYNGVISGESITVTVPHSFEVSVWNHDYRVPLGCWVETGELTDSSGTFTVKDGINTDRVYTVTFRRKQEEKVKYTLNKARNIKKDSATVSATVSAGDEHVHKVEIVYYTKNNTKNHATLTTSGGSYVISGLQPNTKYTYYLVVTTDTKEYTTPSKSFTTKESPRVSSNGSVGTKNNHGSQTQPSSTTEKKHGWVKLLDGWIFYNSENKRVIGWHKDNSKWYYFTPQGYMVSDKWLQYNGVWYVFGNDGAMAQNQWYWSGGKWYYLDENGSMVRSGYKFLNNVWYLFSPEGDLVEDKWVTFSNGKFGYAKPNGLGLARNEDYAYNGITYKFNSECELSE